MFHRSGLELNKEYLIPYKYPLCPLCNGFADDPLPGGHHIGLVKFWLEVVRLQQLLNSLADVDCVVGVAGHEAKVRRLLGSLLRGVVESRHWAGVVKGCDFNISFGPFLRGRVFAVFDVSVKYRDLRV